MKRAKLEERKRFAEEVAFRDAARGITAAPLSRVRYSRSATPSAALHEWWQDNYTAEQIRELAGGIE